MKRGFFFASLLSFALCFAACQKRQTAVNLQTTLNLLVWKGYADESFIKAFEQAHNCKVFASYMGSSDELVSKLSGGAASNYDVVSASSDVAASIVRSGLAEPLDLSKFAAYPKLSPKLRDSTLARAKGKTYGVPFMWSPNPLLYDTTALPEPPDTWAVLWDPRFKGKISLRDDLSSVFMAALLLGFDKPDPTHLYNLSDDELLAVKKKLIELKPNVRKYWTGGELTNLFQNHEIILATGWPSSTIQLRKLNFPIGEVIPKEGAPGWIDYLMIAAASPHKELAEQFLEYMIEAKTQKLVSDVTLCTPANPESTRFLTPGRAKALHVNNPDAYTQRVYFWQDVPRRAKYDEIWNEVKASR